MCDGRGSIIARKGTSDIGCRQRNPRGLGVLEHRRSLTSRRVGRVRSGLAGHDAFARCDPLAGIQRDPSLIVTVAGAPVERPSERHTSGSALWAWRRAPNWLTAASIEAANASADWASWTTTISR